MNAYAGPKKEDTYNKVGLREVQSGVAVVQHKKKSSHSPQTSPRTLVVQVLVLKAVRKDNSSWWVILLLWEKLKSPNAVAQRTLKYFPTASLHSL